MIIELTDKEKDGLVELLADTLGYYHEVLRDSHKTVGAAMVAFDMDPLVAIYHKLDAEKAKKLRRVVKEEIEGYLPD